MPGLPYREIWAVDFEFIANPGDRPVPVCMVAREVHSGRLLRLWQDELPPRPPFPVDENALFVAYMAAAELGCFLELGWPMPARILDPYVEFRAKTNGVKPPGGYGLLSALSFHGLPGITSEQKESSRDLVIRGGPWTPAERLEILDYCQTDVDCLGPLLDRMTPSITARPGDLGQALLRGRYMAAVAHMEQAGVPIDARTLGQFREHWDGIKDELIVAIDKDYGVYDGTTFKAERFVAWLTREGIPWPLTPHGQPSLDRDTFSDMAKVYPQLEPLKQLVRTLSELRLERLAIGEDGRNRASLFPFGARTGRNTPSANGFIFGPARWLRGLIKPGLGQAIAYIDWSFQEVAIAAALSGDKALLEAVDSGDPYLAFAKMAGLAPADATKESHATVRDQCKTCVLGTNYGMGADSLAARLGADKTHAMHLLRLLARTFPVFWQWSERIVDTAILTGLTRSEFGWPMLVTAASRPTALKNFPMQANGAEMLRIAACLATERGVQICAPVHDALLVEAPVGELDQAVAVTREAMAEASRAVLDGLELTTDVSVTSWPDRYADPRGQVMWDRVTEITHRITGTRGTRSAEYRVFLPDERLRSASDDDLAKRYGASDSGKARAQILYEMDRRDQAEARQEEVKQEAQQRLFAKKMAHAEEIERAWLEAEQATNGNMLNRAGREAGIDERSLFTGPESRARRYASEELLNHWQTHHRPTAAMMRGEDTRLGAQYTPPRRAKRGVHR